MECLLTVIKLLKTDTFNGLYNLRNYDVLKGNHLEVKHTVVKDWADGRKYYG